MITKSQIRYWFKDDERYPETYAYDYLRSQTGDMTRSEATVLAKKMAKAMMFVPVKGDDIPTISYMLEDLAIEYIRQYPKVIIDHLIPETSSRVWLRENKWLA